MTVQHAHVGHVYTVRVVVVAGGPRPQIRILDEGPGATPYPIGPVTVNAAALTPAPMRYFGGEARP